MNDFQELCTEIFEGSYPFFAPIALIVIILRIWKRKWTMPETLVLGTLFLHLLLEILQTYSEHGELRISKRYLLPCAPLAFGWAACGLYDIYRYLTIHIKPGIMRWIVRPLIVWHALVLVFDGIYPAVKVHNPSMKNSRPYTAVRRLVPLIREDYHGPGRYAFTPNPLRYETGRRPLIASDYPSVAYFCHGSAVPADDPVHDYVILPGNAPAPANHILKFTVQEGATDIKAYAPLTPPDLPVPDNL